MSASSVPRLLTQDDLEAFLEHNVASAQESGSDGDAYFGPYDRAEPFPVEEVRARTPGRWSMPLTTPGWRRAFGVFCGAQLIACGTVTGASLPAGLHRGLLGIGILRGYRRRGIGRRLVRTIIAWCRAQPSLAWLDLGVFEGNDAARAFFEREGFQFIATTPDRWRLDGRPIADTKMTLEVRHDG